MVIYYLDTSVAVHALLAGPDRDRLNQWIEANTIVSSRLLRTEMLRFLRRESKPLSDANWLLSQVGLIDITRRVHVLAESIERHTKTLDALHLGTALGLEFEVVIATADRNMRDVAEILTLKVMNPLE